MVGGAPAAGSPSSSQAADEAAAVPEEAPQRESCVRHFDALWFCYTPGHQLRQYYRYGDVDDCFGHWELLWACLKQRTRFRGQGDRPAPPCLWQLRSREEAAEAWRSEFGHLEEGAEAPAAASVPASAERSATGAAEGAAGGSAGAGQGSQPMVFAVARGAALRAASAVGGPAEAARQRDLQAQQAHAGAGESRSPGT